MEERRSHVKMFIWIILTVAFLIILMFIQNYYFIQKNMNPDLYRISMGPFLEEAFKGGILVFISFVIIFSNPRFKEKLVKKYWLITGTLIGLFIGLWETFVDYTPGIHRLIPTLNHAFWTAIVAAGIWLFVYTHKRKIVGLVVSYISASVLHTFWNYYAIVDRITGSEFAMGATSFILTVITFFLVWEFDKALRKKY